MVSKLFSLGALLLLTLQVSTVEHIGLIRVGGELRATADDDGIHKDESPPAEDVTDSEDTKK